MQDTPSFYYQGVAALARSIQVSDKNSKFVLYMNRADYLDDFKFKKTGVNIEILQSEYYISDVEEPESFPGSLYTLDVIKKIAQAESLDEYIILDPDCLVIGEIDSRFLERHGCNIGFYKLIEGADYQFNKFPFERYGKDINLIGGEVIMINTQGAKEICQAIGSITDRRGLLTEEHYLTVIANQGKIRYCHINTEVKRIWTRMSYRNCADRDYLYKIIHLPAEKKKGIPRLFDKIDFINSHDDLIESIRYFTWLKESVLLDSISKIYRWTKNFRGRA
ncbi:hypothetical protein [Deinococcus indicus]|uniref:hypothetical protein n=1 Tax=Deinococcus indicus TaxID=223556 RepID=UPI00174AF804|nr:hypothetical protein [Deinococcus indicus]